ncbi:RNA binding motif protein 12Ba [Hippoglossus stenolepis]|uniref:RNA binding motif protein 12Ba n=1 Tax=Hippoglossus stenolepis TaxID=195615 RepID=UPI00159C79C1|nr:RNA binding motif protein 12Ba [Hippoglossus stenolepis]
MAIILCLQGLDVKAGTEDIRKFFKCLFIPNGGVYIVGGSLREAFIAFTTERDAKLAMRHTGDLLKGSKVTLHISSMEELELKLKLQMKRKKEKLHMKRKDVTLQTKTQDVKLQMERKEEKLQIKRPEEKNKNKPSPTQQGVKSPQPSPDANWPSLNAHDLNTLNLASSTARSLDPRIAKRHQPLHQNTATLQTSVVHTLDPNTAFLLGMCTVLQRLQSSSPEQNGEAGQMTDFPNADSKSVACDFVRTSELTLDSSPGYVRLFGLPTSATKEDICCFFTGLEVQEAMVNVKLGPGHGCLVKFANADVACDALHFNNQFLGPICVEVRGATEKMWTGALQECENGMRGKAHPNPLRETANPKQTFRTLPLRKRWSDHLSPNKRIKKPRLYCDSSSTLSPRMDYIVMACNLPKKMTKTEIKELFQCPNIAHKNVLHLLDNEGNRTDTAFLIFNCIEDNDYAINLNGCHVGSAIIEVSSITKDKMKDMMAKTHPRRRMRMKPNQKRKSDLLRTQDGQTLHSNIAAQTCLFVRNLPSDVKVSQIQNLFCKYKPMEDNINLLHDSDGNGIGEAIVQFKSPKLAALAQGLNGQDLMGAQVLLTCMSVKQMNDILAKTLPSL